MAVRANRGSNSRRILHAAHREPDVRARWRESIARNQGIEFESVDFDRASGRASLEALRAHRGEDCAALVVQQPNFFGNLEEVDRADRLGAREQGSA